MYTDKKLPTYEDQIEFITTLRMLKSFKKEVMSYDKKAKIDINGKLYNRYMARRFWSNRIEEHVAAYYEKWGKRPKEYVPCYIREPERRI